MPTRRSINSKKSRSSSTARRKVIEVDTITTEAIVPKPVKDVVTERTEVTTEPEIEIRRPATLAEALTQPPVAVIKAKPTVRRTIVERKRIS